MVVTPLPEVALFPDLTTYLEDPQVLKTVVDYGYAQVAQFLIRMDQNLYINGKLTGKSVPRCNILSESML